MFYWYYEIKQFSSIFGIEAPEWTMSTVNLQKIWSEYVHLKKKSCHYLKKLQFSL